jgi:hypothetical protein
MVREPARDVADLAALYAAKAAAEEDAADALLPDLPVRRAGDPDALVLLVKGEPGTFDLEAGEALAGPDHEAVRAALEALEVDAGSLLAVVSRPVEDATPEAITRRLALYLEACDPALAIALDAVAAEDLAAAAGLRSLMFGDPAHIRGRVLLAVDGLEASLADEERKKRVWAQLRSLKTQQGRR